ncbi:hypothetical protein KNO15_18705 [Leifsonia shinshuensis]|uniref:hypothetical protein n=1 Tax=Leifsonia shinshuensis TaxID=150026 RepID=UPI001F50C846|nr:hypothetical protein [Leifsonia shinshuensis]MCI0158734.1 hypothetical protein [Leifsonia shinshuensis]
MNNTNRALNRSLVLFAGLILFACGVGAFLLATDPSIRNGWSAAATRTQVSLASALTAPAVTRNGPGWLSIAAVVALLLLIVLLLVFVFRQGHGHTSKLFQEGTTGRGRTVIDAALAEHLLHDSLTGRPELITTSVSTYTVRHAAVLKVAVTCRRGVSPRHVATLIEATLRALDTLLGAEFPALVQIGGGIRTRLAKSTRLTATTEPEPSDLLASATQPIASEPAAAEQPERVPAS